MLRHCLDELHIALESIPTDAEAGETLKDQEGVIIVIDRCTCISFCCSAIQMLLRDSLACIAHSLESVDPSGLYAPNRTLALS